jgi:hypothetical protein
MRRVAQAHSVCTPGVEVMSMLDATRIGSHVAILLTDLVTKLVDVDQIKNVSHRSLPLCARRPPPIPVTRR